MAATQQLDYSNVNWRNIFTYKEGSLFWAINPSKGAKKGSEAGYIDTKGYRAIKYKGHMYYAHRIIYAMFNGAIPEGTVVDHINRQPSDNRVENLRAITHQENLFNTSKVSAYRSASGAWWSRIGKNGKNIYLGSFDTKTKAEAAYKKAKATLHGIGA